MKRFHVHLHVDDLAKSVGFYSSLFAAQPARVEGDLGIQTDDPAELALMKARAKAADLTLLDEGESSCCYARSEKHWVTDPQGIAWEHFHTLADIPMFNEAVTPASRASACCASTDSSGAVSTEPTACWAPTPRGKPVGIPITSTSCC